MKLILRYLIGIFLFINSCQTSSNDTKNIFEQKKVEFNKMALQISTSQYFVDTLNDNTNYFWVTDNEYESRLGNDLSLGLNNLKVQKIEIAKFINPKHYTILFYLNDNNELFYRSDTKIKIPLRYSQLATINNNWIVVDSN